MALGDIGAVLDSYEFDDSLCTFPHVCPIGSNIWAIAYEGPSNTILVRTVGISDAGAITDPYIDDILIEGTSGQHANITRMYGNIYAVTYNGPVSTARLATIEISGSGQITDAVIDTYQFYGAWVDYVCACSITNNVLAVIFDDLDAKARLRTIGISNVGAITEPYLDQWVFTATTAEEFKILRVAGNVYAVTYKDNSAHGQVVTMTIAVNGDITKTLIDTLEYSSIDTLVAQFTHSTADIYASVFRRADGHGQITTFEISDVGAIGAAAIESYIFEGSVCFNPHVIYIEGNFVLVAYEGVSEYGQLATIAIADDGDITTPSQSTYEYVQAATGEHFLFAVSSLMFAVAHGEGGDGFIQTFPVETPTAQLPRHELIVGMG